MKIIFLGDSITKGQIGSSYIKFLEEKLVEHEIINYGKNGDSAVSLYKRMNKHKLDHYDIAFLWVGTNDIYARISLKYPIIRKIQNIPYSKNKIIFRKYYEKILEEITKHADKIFTVSPLFIGENFDNKWNKKLDVLNDIIEELSDQYYNVDYVDLRNIFYKKLEGKKISRYIRISIIKTIKDTFLLQTDEKIDWKSQDRGLYFTIDGVHLNSKGASIIADIFYKKIKSEMKK